MQAARLENIFQLQSEPELESWNLFSAGLVQAKIRASVQAGARHHRSSRRSQRHHCQGRLDGVRDWADPKMAKRQQHRTAGAQSSTMSSLTGRCVYTRVNVDMNDTSIVIYLFIDLSVYRLIDLFTYGICLCVFSCLCV